jgi:hypothetical protein
LRLSDTRDAGCVRTDFCHSTHRLRAPASRGFSTGVATLSRARSDEQSGVSRCPIRFGGSSGLSVVVGVFDPCRLLDGVTTNPRTVPLTLLSLFVVPTCPRFARACRPFRNRLGRFSRVSVKITRRSRPEEPSIDDEVTPSMLRRSPRPISRLCRRDLADTARSLVALWPSLSRRLLFATC